MKNVLANQILLLKYRLTWGPRRYINLLRTIREERCRVIVEIGTYDGVHAKQMIDTAALSWPRGQIEYFGFDLFEALTDDDLDREFSKRPPSRHVVEKRLAGTGAQIQLHQGYTQDMLPRFSRGLGASKNIDLVFVDGGHSPETIESDWRNVLEFMDEDTTVLFDDYYTNEQDEVKNIGCRSLIDGLDRDLFEVVILDPEDRFEKSWGSLGVRLVRVKPRTNPSIKRASRI